MPDGAQKNAAQKLELFFTVATYNFRLKSFKGDLDILMKCDQQGLFFNVVPVAALKFVSSVL